eukprot:254520-Prorocentrum_minimum.AAC.1
MSNVQTAVGKQRVHNATRPRRIRLHLWDGGFAAKKAPELRCARPQHAHGSVGDGISGRTAQRPPLVV